MGLLGALAKSAHNNKFDGLKEYDMYLQQDKFKVQYLYPWSVGTGILYLKVK